MPHSAPATGGRCGLPVREHRRVDTHVAVAVASVLIAMMLVWSAAVQAGVLAGRFVPPPDSSMPGGQYGALVRDGYKIFTDTPKYAGQYVGNALSCKDCHLDAGRKPYAIPIWAAYGMFPEYEARARQVIDYPRRLQECFQFSENGYPPPLDSQVVRALTAYSHWLATGAPVGVQMPGRGVRPLPQTAHGPDPVAGRTIYVDQCSTCHGYDGHGLVSDGKYVVPPLWGPASFNRGAGMAKLPVAAAFIKANMPENDADLTDQEAEDVAAWMELQVRPPNPSKGPLAWLLHW